MVPVTEPDTLDLVPAARVGHLGRYRDHETLKPVSYYNKLPEQMDERLAVVVDPMLATGGSGAAAAAVQAEDRPTGLMVAWMG